MVGKFPERADGITRVMRAMMVHWCSNRWVVGAMCHVVVVVDVVVGARFLIYPASLLHAHK